MARIVYPYGGTGLYDRMDRKIHGLLNAAAIECEQLTLEADRRAQTLPTESARLLPFLLHQLQKMPTARCGLKASGSLHGFDQAREVAVWAPRLPGGGSVAGVGIAMAAWRGGLHDGGMLPGPGSFGARRILRWDLLRLAIG